MILLLNVQKCSVRYVTQCGKLSRSRNAVPFTDALRGAWFSDGSIAVLRLVLSEWRTEMYTVSVEEYIDNGMLLYTSVTNFIKLESALHDYTVLVSKFSRDIANHNMLGKSFKLGFW